MIRTGEEVDELLHEAVPQALRDLLPRCRPHDIEVCVRKLRIRVDELAHAVHQHLIRADQCRRRLRLLPCRGISEGLEAGSHLQGVRGGNRKRPSSAGVGHGPRGRRHQQELHEDGHPVPSRDRLPVLLNGRAKDLRHVVVALLCDRDEAAAQVGMGRQHSGQHGIRRVLKDPTMLCGILLSKVAEIPDDRVQPTSQHLGFELWQTIQTHHPPEERDLLLLRQNGSGREQPFCDDFHDLQQQTDAHALLDAAA
eukprot:scaffold870_cov268-Pinguiococcus_pyrenoidosus.AAC.11